MPDICILVLSGFPASGKTTFAKALHEHFNLLHQCVCYHVCYDAILSTDIELKLLEVRGRVSDQSQKPSQWKEYRRKIVKCVEHLISLQQNNNQSGDIFNLNFIDVDYHVMERLRKSIGLEVADPGLDHYWEDVQRRMLLIIDDTMYYRSMRHDYYQIARKYQCGFAQLSLECSLETSLLRNHERSVHVADDVIINMAGKFQAPDPGTHSWETFSLVWNSEFGGNIADVYSLIEGAFENPVRASPGHDEDVRHADRLVSSRSLIHQSDQILRKLVADTMTQSKTDKEEKKLLAKRLNRLRNEILTGLRSGKLGLPPLCQQVQDASKSPDSELFTYIQHVFSAYCQQSVQ